MQLGIFVRTRGRINNQITIKTFCLREIFGNGSPRGLLLRFLVPKCEQAAFLRVHTWAEGLVWAVEDSWMLGDICQYALERPPRYQLSLDDDLIMNRRRNPLHPSQRGSGTNKQDILDAFDRVKEWLTKGYVHGGLSMRVGNHYCSGEYYKNNVRVCGATFVDTHVIREEGIRFDAVQARSDFHMWLSLLELGYLNVCDYEFMVGQVNAGKNSIGGTNAPGGCSRYRTTQFQLEQAQRLGELHPKSVTLIYKQRVSESARKIATEEGIPDVRIGWAKSLGTRKTERKADTTGKIVV